MRFMGAVKTQGNTGITGGNENVTLESLAAQLGKLQAQADEVTARTAAIMTVTSHIDDLLHPVAQSIEQMHSLFTEHEGLIRRAAALADPGAKVRDFMKGGRSRGR
jgi:ABC-type transporter Mla subunit MlaD